jgi:hypothetical protein
VMAADGVLGSGRDRLVDADLEAQRTPRSRVFPRAGTQRVVGPALPPFPQRRAGAGYTCIQCGENDTERLEETVLKLPGDWRAAMRCSVQTWAAEWAADSLQGRIQIGANGAVNCGNCEYWRQEVQREVTAGTRPASDLDPTWAPGESPFRQCLWSHRAMAHVAGTFPYWVPGGPGASMDPLASVAEWLRVAGGRSGLRGEDSKVLTLLVLREKDWLRATREDWVPQFGYGLEQCWNWCVRGGDGSIPRCTVLGNQTWESVVKGEKPYRDEVIGVHRRKVQGDSSRQWVRTWEQAPGNVSGPAAAFKERLIFRSRISESQDGPYLHVSLGLGALAPEVRELVRLSNLGSLCRRCALEGERRLVEAFWPRMERVASGSPLLSRVRTPEAGRRRFPLPEELLVRAAGLQMSLEGFGDDGDLPRDSAWKRLRHRERREPAGLGYDRKKGGDGGGAKVGAGGTVAPGGTHTVGGASSSSGR